MNHSIRLAVVCLTLSALAACGGEDDTSSTASSSVPDSASSAPATSGDVVEVKASDKLAFDPEVLTAKPGVEFRGTLTQVGSIPHNIEIKDLGVTAESTMVTKDGESKAFSFTAEKPGEFGYVCTIHPATMRGTVRVS